MEVLDDLSSVGIVLGTIAFTFCMSLMTFLCLKIKSTKKNPELLGIVGTVKPLEDLEENSHCPPPSSFKMKTSPRLRHNQNNPTNNPNYAPVSETSDDMYAAIEDPTYLPTGNQSNSDTYAVINLPEDDDEEEVELRSAHTYSQVDKSRKRKAMSHQPTTKPPAAPVLNNNVDDMYAKVQKNISPPRRSWNSKKSSDPAYETVSDPADNLPMGASAMRTSAEHLLGARPRLPPHHRHQINYSDYEVAHYDPNTSKHANVATTNKNEDQELGYETVPENRSFLQQRSNNDHEGYERVEDYWRSNGSDVDAGYELVRRNSKRGGGAGGNSGSGGGGGTSGRSASGFERLTFSSSSKKTDPGYETVPPRPPLPRMNQYHDPPYARLENSKDEEMLSEEGYETTPGSERQNRNGHRGGGFDPGYESVPDKRGQGSEPGYETLPGNEAIHMFRDPGYETLVQNKPDPGYATVVEPRKKVVEHGYENLVQSGEKKPDHHKDHQKTEIKSNSSNSIHTTSSGGIATAPSSLTSVSNSVNVVHMSVRKTQSDPPEQLIVPPPRVEGAAREQLIVPPPRIEGMASKPPMLLPRNPTTSVVVIEHTSTKLAVNNNVMEENQNQIQQNYCKDPEHIARGQQDGKDNSSNEKQIQSHIFV